MAKQLPNEELSQAQIQAEIDELEHKLERLRVRYEQYFLGIEKIPPTVLRTDVVRIMRQIEHYQVRNTAMKFRFRSLVQKFHSYSTYWNRTIREIESGTFRRHVEKARNKRDRRAERLAAQRGAQGEGAARAPEETERGREQVAAIASAADDFLASMGLAPAKAPPPPSAPRRGIQVDFEDLDDDFDAGFGARPDTGLKPSLDVFGSASAPPPQRSAAAGAPPPLPPSRARVPAAPTPRPSVPVTGSAAAASTRNTTQRLYDEFVAARERLGMNEKKVSYEKFSSSLDKQAEQVRRAHACSDVEFRVVVKDGKPFLKPVPKK